VLGVKVSGDRAPNELGLVIDRERAQQQGVNPQVVAGVVGYALRGQVLNRYRTADKDIPVRIHFREEDRETLDQLKGFYVPAGNSGFVPLSSVADVRVLASSQGIYRQDKRTMRTVTLELAEGREDEARAHIVGLQNQLALPEGVRFGESAKASENDDLAALRFAATLSVVFIYLLMGFLFESFILPLSIIATIPLAGIGVIWAHALLGYNIDFLGVVGIVLLIGVVVNNGIVLIDYANRLRERGMERREALLMAADRRFRPIMMTALTTICGMVPVTLSGASSIGLSYTSFGLTLIGGLTTATLLTLLVVPVFYTFFDDVQLSFGRAVRHALGAGGRDKGPGPEGESGDKETAPAGAVIIE
jgi:hydrophobic/amphiphilic exporter-1 (mainly G- bacteria), HAE1 family